MYKVEGINNKIKSDENAYGYRDDEYFKLRLFALLCFLVSHEMSDEPLLRSGV